MQKYIEKIENCNNYPRINNLTIETLGNFNLFSGKDENGYSDLMDEFREKERYNKKVLITDDAFHWVHYMDLKRVLNVLFANVEFKDYQIFTTTQRYDVIKAFAEVAQEYKDVEAYYYRLGRSGRTSQNGHSIVTMYDADRLLELTKQNIEVR